MLKYCYDMAMAIKNRNMSYYYAVDMVMLKFGCTEEVACRNLDKYID